MDKFEKGNTIAKEFEIKIEKIADSEFSYENKIHQISIELEKAAEPLNRIPDDRVLSIINTISCDFVERIVAEEIKNADDFKLNEIKKEIENLAWLSSGFKSSINLKIAFAKVKLKQRD